MDFPKDNSILDEGNRREGDKRAEGKQEENQGCGHHRNQSKEALL